MLWDVELFLLNIGAVLLVSLYKSAFLFWSVLHETDSFHLAPYFCPRCSFSLHKSSVQLWFSCFGGSADNFGSNCGICTRLGWINTNWPGSMLSSSRWGLNTAAPYPPCAQRVYFLVCILHLLLLHLGHLSTLALFLHLPSHALQRVHLLRAP